MDGIVVVTTRWCEVVTMGNGNMDTVMMMYRDGAAADHRNYAGDGATFWRGECMCVYHCGG